MNKERRFTLKKEERIRNVKQIEYLFSHGQSFVSYPLRVVFVEQEGVTPSQVSIFVSVPKKKLKSAVDRNRIKRLIREAYRLNKYTLDRSFLKENQTLAIAFVYLKPKFLT
jgi:ribonuclease P protein component